MIEKVNMGVSESRIQQGEPPYFVNYKFNGEQRYEYFHQPFMAHERYNFLKALEELL